MIRLVSSVIFVVALFVCVQTASAGGDQTRHRVPPLCRARPVRGPLPWAAPREPPVRLLPAHPRSSAVANREVVDLHKGHVDRLARLRRPRCDLGAIL